MFQGHADHLSCSFKGNPATPYLKTRKQTYKNNAVLANCPALQRAPPRSPAALAQCRPLPAPGLVTGCRQLQRVWLCSSVRSQPGAAPQEPALSREHVRLVSKDALTRRSPAGQHGCPHQKEPGSDGGRGTAAAFSPEARPREERSRCPRIWTLTFSPSCSSLPRTAGRDHLHPGLVHRGFPGRHTGPGTPRAPPWPWRRASRWSGVWSCACAPPGPTAPLLQAQPLRQWIPQGVPVCRAAQPALDGVCIIHSPGATWRAVAIGRGTTWHRFRSGSPSEHANRVILLVAMAGKWLLVVPPAPHLRQPQAPLDQEAGPLQRRPGRAPQTLSSVRTVTRASGHSWPRSRLWHQLLRKELRVCGKENKELVNSPGATRACVGASDFSLWDSPSLCKMQELLQTQDFSNFQALRPQLLDT